MLAAGINTPAQLAELEAHLRDDVCQFTRTGLDERKAFENAAARALARPAIFGPEISSCPWIYDHEPRSRPAPGSSTAPAASITQPAASCFPSQSAGFQFSTLFTLSVLFNFIYLRGLIASIQLFEGSRNACRFIIFLSGAGRPRRHIGVLSTKSFQPLSIAFTILGLVTLWILWPRRQLKTATE